MEIFVRSDSYHTFSSILPICINTHGQYTTPVCPNVHTKYRKFIFSRVFEFALAEFCAKFMKMNAPWILPRLQYLVAYILPGGPLLPECLGGSQHPKATISSISVPLLPLPLPPLPLLQHHYHYHHYHHYHYWISSLHSAVVALCSLSALVVVSTPATISSISVPLPPLPPLPLPLLN